MQKLARAIPIFTLLVIAFTLTGCYNASIVTDAAPSNQTVEKKWASGFLFGLVPPSTVETAERCPSGVARVETKLSFLNMLASNITFGLYTPMSITVTCAQSGSAMLDADVVTVPRDADAGAIQMSMQTAAKQSIDTGQPATIRFE